MMRKWCCAIFVGLVDIITFFKYGPDVFKHATFTVVFNMNSLSFFFPIIYKPPFFRVSLAAAAV